MKHGLAIIGSGMNLGFGFDMMLGEGIVMAFFGYMLLMLTVAGLANTINKMMKERGDEIWAWACDEYNQRLERSELEACYG